MTTDSARSLRVAYTPDSDDIFNYYAWHQGHVRLRTAFDAPSFHRDHISALNRAATAEQFDIVAVSAAYYPRIAQDYWILSVGNSVGRDWGPALVARDFATLDQLRGQRVAVSGHPTTGSTLARIYCPEADLVEMRYDAIIDAISRGDVAAGVMIHEELLCYAEKGLRCVADLGQAWCNDTRLPLPVGLNVIHKRLGKDLAHDVADTCHRSLLWALEHPEEVFTYANQFGRGRARQHVEMFRSQDTLGLAADVRLALRVMFDRVAELHLGPQVESIEVIDV